VLFACWCENIAGRSSLGSVSGKVGNTTNSGRSRLPLETAQVTGNFVDIGVGRQLPIHDCIRLAYSCLGCSRLGVARGIEMLVQLGEILVVPVLHNYATPVHYKLYNNRD